MVDTSPLSTLPQGCLQWCPTTMPHPTGEDPAVYELQWWSQQHQPRGCFSIAFLLGRLRDTASPCSALRRLFASLWPPSGLSATSWGKALSPPKDLCLITTIPPLAQLNYLHLHRVSEHPQYGPFFRYNTTVNNLLNVTASSSQGKFPGPEMKYNILTDDCHSGV